MHTDHAEERCMTAGYQIDAEAVADAILTRLLVGRTLTPPRGPRHARLAAPAPAARVAGRTACSPKRLVLEAPPGRGA